MGKYHQVVVPKQGAVVKPIIPEPNHNHDVARENTHVFANRCPVMLQSISHCFAYSFLSG